MTIGTDLTTSVHLHERYTGSPPDNTAAAAIATAAEAAFQAGPILSMGAWTALTSVEIRDLSSASGGYAKKLVNHPGTAGGAVIPANACALASYAIQRRYRGGKPRTYFPMGTDTDLLDAQHWVAASVTNFTTRVATLSQQLAAITWTGGNATGLCSVSYYSGTEWVQNPVTGAWKGIAKQRATPLVDPVIGIKVSPLVASQRRRVRGRLS